MSIQPVSTPFEPHIEKIPKDPLGTILGFLEPQHFRVLESCSPVRLVMGCPYKQLWMPMMIRFATFKGKYYPFIKSTICVLGNALNIRSISLGSS